VPTALLNGIAFAVRATLGRLACLGPTAGGNAKILPQFRGQSSVLRHIHNVGFISGSNRSSSITNAMKMSVSC